MKTVSTRRPFWRFRRPLILTVGLLSLIIAGTIFFSSRPTINEGIATQTQDTATGVVVKTATATLESPIQIRAGGTVEAYSSVTMKSDVDGQLTELHFSEGQYVKRGEPLFTVDSRSSNAVVEQTNVDRSEVAAQQPLAVADLSKDRAQARAAEVEADRYEGLYRDGVVSKEEADRMRAIAERLETVVRTDQDAMAISSAQGLVSDAEAGDDSTKSQSPNHSIRSPIDGLVKNLAVNPGETLSAKEATTLVTIEQVNPIYVSFGVPASGLSDLKRCVGRGELRVAATISDDTSNAEQGSIGFIDDTASAGTGTALLKATFDNKDRQLLPGQLVNVVLTLKLPPDSVVIPSSAVKIEGQGRFVFVVQSDQTVESRPVVVAETVGDKSVITSGLTPGEIVVTDSQVPLQPGSKVNTTDNVDGLADTAGKSESPGPTPTS